MPPPDLPRQMYSEDRVVHRGRDPENPALYTPTGAIEIKAVSSEDLSGSVRVAASAGAGAGARASATIVLRATSLPER